MALIFDTDHYEYEIAPEVSVLWGLAAVRTLPDGTESERINYKVHSRAEAESTIEDAIRREPSEPTRIAASLLSVTAHFADGSLMDFWIILDVTDWRCLDCRTDMRTVDEYYLLRDELWLSIVPDRVGHLCIGCVEGRLGRLLGPDDFQPGRASLDGRYSDRLRDRTGVPDA
ncbi:hypothetical protein GII33_20925 [Gordonia pseudamarae]|jgi:hypothetical protein|uniref:Uncharacterized protein n=1 Tax=Gordonia pseudamarae TaxID=2831662 RepID=A0ABX6IM01_9ACTN|nr:MULTISPECIES: hypothetical protein [Gordonia]MBD0021968.1 hypothetical protein [Gordonia sp. (in: high G+C Gram-positive bacteria)]QHN28071.1 hypothetical protein GII33_20925 [Gordonia pseudamarae]QHN36933.1 hypothetical protein GII31_20560 [Gordonia pseudamarae]